MSHEQKNTPTFHHYWLLQNGILVMVYDNPHITGVGFHSPTNTLNNRKTGWRDGREGKSSTSSFAFRNDGRYVKVSVSMLRVVYMYIYKEWYVHIYIYIYIKIIHIWWQLCFRILLFAWLFGWKRRIQNIFTWWGKFYGRTIQNIEVSHKQKATKIVKTSNLFSSPSLTNISQEDVCITKVIHVIPGQIPIHKFQNLHDFANFFFVETVFGTTADPTRSQWWFDVRNSPKTARSFTNRKAENAGFIWFGNNSAV